MLNFDLQKRITELEDHNQKLLAENKRLREMLGISEETISPKQETANFQNFVEESFISMSSVNKYSSPEEKIELFMSLFCSRTDVYANNSRCY
jgi:Uncharacterized protein conserved in bacteria